MMATSEAMPRTLLIVEDDPEVRDFFALFLSSLGYRTLHAETRDRALEVMQHVRPDAILLDWYMPGLGVEPFLSIVRDMPDPPLVVMISAGEALVEKCRGLNIEHYLAKPFEPEIVAANLQRWLGCYARK